MSIRKPDSLSKFFKDYTPLSYYFLKYNFCNLSFDARYQIISGASQSRNAGVNYVLDNYPKRFVDELTAYCVHTKSNPLEKSVWTPDYKNSQDGQHDYPSIGDLNNLKLLNHFYDEKIPEPNKFWEKDHFERLLIANNFICGQPDYFVSIIIFGDDLVEGRFEATNPLYSKRLAEKVSAQDVEEVLIQFILGVNCRSVREKVEQVKNKIYVTPLFFDFEEDDESCDVKIVNALWSALPNISSRLSRLLIRYLPSIDIFFSSEVDDVISKIDVDQLRSLLFRDDIYLLELRRKILLADDSADDLRCAAVGSSAFSVDADLIDDIIGDDLVKGWNNMPNRRHAARYLLAYCKNLSLHYIMILKDWLIRTRLKSEPCLDEMEWIGKHMLTQHVWDAEIRRIRFLSASEDRTRVRHEVLQAEIVLFGRRLAMGQFLKEDLSQIKEEFRRLTCAGNPWVTYQKIVREIGNDLFPLDLRTPGEIEKLLFDSSSYRIPEFAKADLFKTNQVLTYPAYEERIKILDQRLGGLIETLSASMAESRNELHELIREKNDNILTFAKELENFRNYGLMIIAQRISRLSRSLFLVASLILAVLGVLLILYI